MRTRPLPLLALTVCAAASLAGCVRFGPKTPTSLLTLASTAQVAPGPARTVSDGQAVLVALPSVPAELAALRVPVRTTPNEIAYLKDATWADAPARLFRNVLADAIGARTGRLVLDPRGAAVSPGIRLSGRLQSFGLDVAKRSAVVTFDGSLARANTATVAARRFHAEVPVTAEDGPNVAAALSQASNQIAAEVADWIGA